MASGLGASVAGAESATLFSGYLFPTLLHQDPRYFRSRQNDISDRLAYAASRVLIGRSDSGHNVINTSQILGQFAQAAVSNAYIPYRNESVAGTIENALAGIGSIAQADILNEFWPDIKELFARHNPSALTRHHDPSSMTIVIRPALTIHTTGRFETLAIMFFVRRETARCMTGIGGSRRFALSNLPQECDARGIHLGRCGHHEGTERRSSFAAH